MTERMNLRLCLKVHGSLACTVVPQPLDPVRNYSFIFLLYGVIVQHIVSYGHPVHVCL